MIEEIIKYKLDNYLLFDSNYLFESCDLMRVFGGAIRDSICGDKISDVDILVGSDSIHLLEGFLTSIGWKYMDNLQPKDLSSIYTDIRVINEPHTWMNGDRIIQLIRPSINNTSHRRRYRGEKIDEYYIQGFNELISNVDISCCGVSWDGKVLFEDFKGSISHCQNKVYSINKNAKMYSEKRILHRLSKFDKRGWREIEVGTNINRDLKLNILL